MKREYSSSVKIQLATTTDNIIIIGIKIKNGPRIFSAYSPPQNKITTQDLNCIFKVTTSVILMGDLNAHHTTWSSNNIIANGRLIYNYVNSRPIVVLDIQKPTTRPYCSTARPTAIDITIVKNPTDRFRVAVLDELNSDHLPCLLETNYQIPREEQISKPNYKKTDWKKISYHITLKDRSK